jgi:hypothetical protein
MRKNPFPSIRPQVVRGRLEAERSESAAGPKTAGSFQDQEKRRRRRQRKDKKSHDQGRTKASEQAKARKYDRQLEHQYCQKWRWDRIARLHE